MKRQALLTICFLVIYRFALATDFIVTSNADSGPGTLREAITQASANGIVDKDFIKFNLSNTTIDLKTTLPPLSSNLVIDGTSQKSKLGFSDAHVTISKRLPLPNQNPAGILIGNGINKFEIYGIEFDYNGEIGFAAINLRSSSDIILGAPGIGNVFGSMHYAVIMLKCNNIKISSNWFGLKTDKTEAARAYFPVGLQLSVCNNIIIGGDLPEEGNTFQEQLRFIIVQGFNPETGNIEAIADNCLVKNNIFGLAQVAKSVSLEPNIFRDVKQLSLIKNKSTSSWSFEISRIPGTATIQGNNFGQILSGATPLILQSCAKVIIGGTQSGEENSFSNTVNSGSSGIIASDCGDVSIQGTSIYCIKDGGVLYNNMNSRVEIPVININSNSNNTITGTSTPNADIEVFSTGPCSNCEAKTLAARTKADNTGNWQSPLPAGTGFTATATLNGRTSLFARAYSDFSTAVVTHSGCTLNSGSIKGIKIFNGTSIRWTNSKGDVVGTTADIENLAPDVYTLVSSMGTCQSEPKSYRIVDSRPALNTNMVDIKASSCGQNNGSINGLSLTNSSNFTIKTMEWRNEKNEVKGSSISLTNAAPGVYTLSITTTSNCSITAGPYTIPVANGPVPDLSNQKVNPATCNTKNGSVTGITISSSSTITYTWKNEKQEIVGTTADLLNIAAGTYTLEAKDVTACAALISVTIPELNGISLNEANASITSSSCSDANGSITGILIAGATTLEWRDENNKVVGTSADLKNVLAGKYQLFASNSSCTKTSAIYTLTQLPSMPYNIQSTIIDAECNQKNGSISLLITGIQPAKIKWVNSSNIIVGADYQITGLLAGSYDLFLTDGNNCEAFYKKYILISNNGAIINRSAEKVTNDQCGQLKGSIRGPELSSGKLPYFYEWKDVQGKVLGNSTVLENIGAGTYSLIVGDATVCARQTIVYELKNDTRSIVAPIVKDVTVCSPGNVIIEVSKPEKGIFTLYAAEGSIIIQNETGVFSTTVASSLSFFVDYRLGNCSSEKTEVKVSVSDFDLQITNTITPNGDGINDQWLIPELKNYPNARVEIYNRYGQPIFKSLGYKVPFDGRREGTPLGSGTYYYVIDLRSGCTLRKGSLTILR